MLLVALFIVLIVSAACDPDPSPLLNNEDNMEDNFEDPKYDHRVVPHSSSGDNTDGLSNRVQSASVGMPILVFVVPAVAFLLLITLVIVAIVMVRKRAKAPTQAPKRMTREAPEAKKLEEGEANQEDSQQQQSMVAQNQQEFSAELTKVPSSLTSAEMVNKYSGGTDATIGSNANPTQQSLELSLSSQHEYQYTGQNPPGMATAVD